MLIYLFGGYRRTGHFPSGQPCQMGFLTLKAAEKYGNTLLSGFDPYQYYLTGPIVFVPGKLFRKVEKVSC